jgi:hypothetical protein
MNIRSLVEDFSDRLSSLIEHQVIDRARALIGGTLGRTGRSVTHNGRKKAPKQLCPVPGCKNAAAPVFGMVCAQHKNVSKAKIKKYRQARRAKKLKAAA